MLQVVASSPPAVSTVASSGSRSLLSGVFSSRVVVAWAALSASTSLSTSLKTNSSNFKGVLYHVPPKELKAFIVPTKEHSVVLFN